MKIAMARRRESSPGNDRRDVYVAATIDGLISHVGLCLNAEISRRDISRHAIFTYFR